MPMGAYLYEVEVKLRFEARGLDVANQHRAKIVSAAADAAPAGAQLKSAGVRFVNRGEFAGPTEEEWS